MSLDNDYILQVRGLTKTFSGVTALDNVQLNLRKGEVHALMGENGAGKSTFMKILIGLLRPDSGEIIFEGDQLSTKNVSESLKKGISMIHQEILIVPELTVAQNIFLGREMTRLLPGWLDDQRIYKQAEVILSQMGVDIDARTKMKYLSVAEMQMVEIAKAISNDARVIIMDEPTSAISDKEVATLFAIIKELTRKGVAIIYISHKMDEIFAISDTITVLRDGQYIATKSASEIDTNSLISMMVGREIDSLFPATTARKGEEILSVKNLGRDGKFSGISFAVRAGEILGIAGLMGAGRTEIARAIFGLDRLDRGEIRVKGERVNINSPQDAIRHGIGYVSEDRKGLGFVANLSVKDNITLSSLLNHRKGLFIQKKSELGAASNMVGSLQIKASSIDQKVANLSGGNQQKVVIGKVLLSSPAVIILDEPTRGIDIGAKFEIYKLINQLVAKGLAVIIISSELPELVGMSDRILVLSRGEQTAVLSKEEATQEAIMAYAMPH
ncbi:sugar ABC transporter ATP-binding protein [Spirosoma endbachense]|uniref:ATP-binding cassette domain-containing protein n=1 Tax=Spirosoma endbachense TaxID=2666025 RepID=A0A6P1W6Y7_9BACT|nr:sugar ABC transporter ATP-binding protein [Spirosoma endbachense]QHV99680.1 ATP-binding cassette domain-containing protein [Spirosoma endbachense]